MKQSTFSGYLNEQRQHNLWPLLPQILEAFPRLSRHWLYFGEGPMLIGQGVPLDQPVPLQELMRTAEGIAADCHGSWGQVLRMIVDGAREELEQQSASPDASKELAEARAEIARLQKKTEMLLTRTVELQDELLNVHKAEKAEREKRAEKSSAEESVGRAAHTGHTAARS
ncbi:hypothetical protein [Desulfovibrio sp. UIB00]|uniref:hypothetical protein n=1 Tax=Desulfovibrio sp. UIB00 TaxID=2804314 RepID=UPI001F0D8679|nr:hypothetical protein [Desulfovibrio sp. UIB00]